MSRGSVGGSADGLLSAALQHLPEFSGAVGEDAGDWMEEVERLGQVYGRNQGLSQYPGSGVLRMTATWGWEVSGFYGSNGGSS